MIEAEPLLRSVLFVPAANGRALDKSISLTADALIFDLEDSAADEEKDAARERLRAHLLARPKGRALRVVRINPLATRHGTEDLLMARGARVDAVLLPKVESPRQLHEADDALVETDAPECLKLWAMVETPKGVRHAADIAEARLRHGLGALAIGPNDLVSAADLQLSPGRPELMPWLGPVLVAGKAAGVPVLDGVWSDLADIGGFEAECAQARRMGFAGKTLVHPAQIAGANAGFAPSQDEVERARRLVAAFAAPEQAGRGVIRHEGRMVELLHLHAAERLLARAASIEERTDP